MRSRMAAVAAAAASLAVVLVTSGGSGAGAEPPVGSTEVFAPVGAPGNPEGIAVVGQRVYVGTNTTVRGNPGQGPSKVFEYNIATGELLREHVVQGQRLDDTHGVVGMAPGQDGVVFVADRSPARILRIDFSASPSAQTTYATLPDLPSCNLAAPPCSPTVTDLVPYPDGIAFGADGSLYVSDFQQAVIFRVPPGGGAASVWFADARLESPFGPNGIAFDQAGTTMYFAMTGAMQPPATTKGTIYTLPVTSAPTAADLKPFFVYPEPAAAPDGIAFGKSGNLYVALAAPNAVSVLSPDAVEVARFPSPAGNAAQALSSVPYDMPASIAFDNATRSILVTNHTYFAGDPSHAVVFRAFVDDTAQQLSKP